MGVTEGSTFTLDSSLGYMLQLVISDSRFFHKFSFQKFSVSKIFSRLQLRTFAVSGSFYSMFNTEI